jgi:hypothetical protein
MSGWYRMHRGWMDHPVFGGEEFSRRDAFQWLIQEAAFKPTRVHVPGGSLELQRGQLGYSLRYLARAWKWSEPRVRRFLKATQEAKIIDASTDAGQTVITICNYDKYQLTQEVTDAASDADVTQLRSVSDAKKKEGKEKKEEEGARGRASDGKAYGFEGTVVRLTAAHLDRWRQTYHGIPDMIAELTSIDAWFAGQDEAAKKDWFQRTNRMLNRAHQRAVAEKPAAPASNLVHFDAAIRRMERFEQQERERQERERTAGERA